MRYSWASREEEEKEKSGESSAEKSESLKKDETPEPGHMTLLEKGRTNPKSHSSKKRSHRSSGSMWMQIWEYLTLFCIFMVDPPLCSTFVIQPQNQTPPPPRSIRLSDVTVRLCGQPETSIRKQQDQRKTRGFPEGQSPLDPLSISPVKLKRTQKERQRRPKGCQRRRAGADSLQTTSGQNASLTEFRSGQRVSVDPTEKIINNNTNTSSSQQQRLDTSGTTAPISNTQKIPSGRTRTSRLGAGAGFGLPVDRIGLGRLPSGRH